MRLSVIAETGTWAQRESLSEYSNTTAHSLSMCYSISTSSVSRRLYAVVMQMPVRVRVLFVVDLPQMRACRAGT